MKKNHQLWLDQYLDNLRFNNKSPETILNYRADLLKFIHWYEAYFPFELNRADAKVISLYRAYLSGLDVSKKTQDMQNTWEKIMQLFKSLKAIDAPSRQKKLIHLELREMSVNSKRRHLSSIKNFYEYLVQVNDGKNKYFKSNPVKSKIHGITLKETDVENTVLLTEKDWKRITDTIFRPKEKLIAWLLYWGGLRLHEVSGLRVSDFDDETLSLKFKRKGGYIHTLQIQKGPQIFEFFEQWLATRKRQSEYVFPNSQGQAVTPRAMYNTVKNIILKSACPTPGLTPHSFRKACATRLYTRTKDLLYVRDYLNHSDAKVTQTYIERKRTTKSYRPSASL